MDYIFKIVEKSNSIHDYMLYDTIADQECGFTTFECILRNSNFGNQVVIEPRARPSILPSIEPPWMTDAVKMFLVESELCGEQLTIHVFANGRCIASNCPLDKFKFTVLQDGLMLTFPSCRFESVKEYEEVMIKPTHICFKEVPYKKAYNKVIVPSISSILSRNFNGLQVEYPTIGDEHD